MSERLHTYHVLSAEEVRTMAEALSKSDASQVFIRFFDDMCASHETLRAQLAAREAALREILACEAALDMPCRVDCVCCYCNARTALAPASAQEGGEHAPAQPSACAGRAEGPRP